MTASVRASDDRRIRSRPTASRISQPAEAT
jgi:hypothetical protein